MTSSLERLAERPWRSEKSLQLTGEVELDVLWLKSADPGRPPNAGSEALWRESSSSNGPLGLRTAICPSLEAELLVKPSEDDGWLGVELRWILWV